MWTTIYLCPLKDGAEELNQLALNGLPSNYTDVVFYTQDFENNERLPIALRTRIFRKGTNFPPVITCKIGTKVMFLTNGILISKNITNGSLGIIIGFLENGDIEAAFPIKEGIQVYSTNSIYEICNSPTP
jgi:hypothetical protein